MITSVTQILKRFSRFCGCQKIELFTKTTSTPHFNNAEPLGESIIFNNALSIE